jgi:hypothetical protein
MALLPPFYLDSVVAIGVDVDQNNRTWIATGFIIGTELIEDINKAIEEKRYKLWLITNKHVLDGLKNVWIKFNSALTQDSKDYSVTLISRNGKTYWVGHPNPNIDVAAIQLNPSFLKSEGMNFQFIRNNDQMMNREKLKQNGITEGDRVFVLGFPMGIVSSERQYVICRMGCIARIRDFLENKVTDYIIDAPVFPGNSGGPVIICPSALSILGTSPIERADLIGIVKSYIPYRDFAYSSQTKTARVIFEENSGLAAVESVDSILETVAFAEKRMKSRNAQAKYRLSKKE